MNIYNDDGYPLIRTISIGLVNTDHSLTRTKTIVLASSSSSSSSSSFNTEENGHPLVRERRLSSIWWSTQQAQDVKKDEGSNKTTLAPETIAALKKKAEKDWKNQTEKDADKGVKPLFSLEKILKGLLTPLVPSVDSSIKSDKQEK